MKLIIEPTPEFFLTDDGFPVRAWKGETGKGVRVVAFIAAVGIEPGGTFSALAELEAELQTIPGPPSLRHFEVRPEMNEPGCKNRGGAVSTLGHCLICDAEAGETCRLTEIRPS
jgi:hypothetical protein